MAEANPEQNTNISVASLGPKRAGMKSFQGFSGRCAMKMMNIAMPRKKSRRASRIVVLASDGLGKAIASEFARLGANLAVFRMQQENVAEYAGQVPQDPSNPTGPTRSSYTGADGMVSKGFEAEVVGEVMQGWQVSMGYSRFKAEDPDGSDANTMIPRRQFNLFTSYQLLQGLTVGGGVRWQSRSHVWQSAAQALGVPALEQRAYSVVDLMARYQFTPQWSAQLNIGNLLDKRYFAPTEDGMQLFWQAPRNTSVNLRYQF